MKKIIIGIILLISFFFIGLFIIKINNKPDNIKEDTYEIVDILPDGITFNKNAAGEELKLFNGYYYLFIKMGEFPTGGYSISIKDIKKEDDKYIIYVNRTYPNPTDMVTQAFTYPYVCIKFSNKPNYEVKTYDLRR